MNASKAWADEKLRTVGRGTPRTDFLLSCEQEMREPHALWSLEEIEAPEVWTLASFDDLLPHELVATADRYSPYVEVFARSQTMKRIVRLNGEEL